MQRHVPLPVAARSFRTIRSGTWTNYDQKLETDRGGLPRPRRPRGLGDTTCWFSVLFEKVLAAANARGRRAGSVARTSGRIWVLFGGGVTRALPPARLPSVSDGRTILMDNYNATEGGLFAVTDRLGARGCS